ncbi:Transcription intermediary factor 1-alpha [Mactra antiquata]
MAEAQVEETTVDQYCQPCSKKNKNSVADKFCVNCKEFQCEDCINGHNTNEYMKNHRIVSIAEGQTHVSSTECDDLDATIYMCVKHNKQFEFYCQEDDALFCSKCAVTSHKKCENIVDIESMDGHSGCDKLKNELFAAINSTNQVTELLEDADSRLSDDIRALSDKLKDMKNRFIQIFDDFTNEILTHASVYSKSTKDDLAKKKVKCETQIQSMKKTVKTLDSVMSTGTPAEQFITERRMLDDVHNAVKDATSIHEELSRIDILCSFEDQVKKFKSKLESEFNSESFNISYYLSNSSKLEFVRSIELKATSDNLKEPMYTGLSFLPDNRLVALDNLNHKCLIYDVNLNVKNSYKLPYEYPKCVAAVSNDEIVVTSGGKYRLDFLNVSKTNELTVKRTCEMNAQYFSISMMNNGNFVVSTVDHIKPFRIVCMSGEETEFNIKTSSKKYPLGTNYCTYICGREILVQTDTDEDKIYIYNIESGENVMVKDKLVKSPCSVAVGPYDHVFVASKGTNCTVEITPGGRVLSSHQVDMDYPLYIAISKDKKLLAVSNAATGAKKLSLYKIA